ncbi:XPG domain containing-domain-containing protein [Phaeosphaeria sp. MPI-PUGE-AT-0046c]|nr:XPG domain containing-domain-containing protein [Phaeosphaeria sp. MPI-PUGE-AT-0046c]
MGIPGLARRLAPYSSRCSEQDLKGYSAIVDGPSLAYEAHRLAFSAAATQTRIPSYADINNEAVKWLSALEEQGINVATIIFDGALPESKQAERVPRTEQNNRRVQQLRASYPATTCPTPTYLSSTSYAFLAPSLREALGDSPFASRTRIVSGEADDFCALYAKDHPKSIIFTSDTDLLLFDYDPETLVALFMDADSLAGLKTYSPYQVAEKLHVKSLVLFAYAIQQLPYGGTVDISEDACKVDVDSRSYLNFSQRYIAAMVTPKYMQENSNLTPPLQALDVRVSEYVFEALNASQNLAVSIAQSLPHLVMGVFEFVREALSGSQSIPVYLPLLVEDPNLASAWNMAQDVRTLAYSLLAPGASKISEYRRKAQHITPEDINPLPAIGVQMQAKELEERISGLLKWSESKDISPTLLWSLFALSLVLVELNTPPTLTLVSRVLNGDFDNTWTYIQFTARLQAAMYSLRMLKQVTTVWLPMNPQAESELHASLSQIDFYMSNFPSISDMFIVPGQAHRVVLEHEQLKRLIEEIFISAGVEVKQVSNKKKKRQTREAERKMRKAEQRQQAKPSNLFALLDSGGPT